MDAQKNPLDIAGAFDKLRDANEMDSWTAQQMSEWLHSVGCVEFSCLVRTGGITGETFLRLPEWKLQRLIQASPEARSKRSTINDEIASLTTRALAVRNFRQIVSTSSSTFAGGEQPPSAAADVSHSRIPDDAVGGVARIPGAKTTKAPGHVAVDEGASSTGTWPRTGTNNNRSKSPVPTRFPAASAFKGPFEPARASPSEQASPGVSAMSRKTVTTGRGQPTSHVQQQQQQPGAGDQRGIHAEGREGHSSTEFAMRRMEIASAFGGARKSSGEVKNISLNTEQQNFQGYYQEEAKPSNASFGNRRTHSSSSFDAASHQQRKESDWNKTWTNSPHSAGEAQGMGSSSNFRGVPDENLAYGGRQYQRSVSANTSAQQMKAIREAAELISHEVRKAFQQRKGLLPHAQDSSADQMLAAPVGASNFLTRSRSPHGDRRAASSGTNEERKPGHGTQHTSWPPDSRSSLSANRNPISSPSADSGTESPIYNSIDDDDELRDSIIPGSGEVSDLPGLDDDHTHSNPAETNMDARPAMRLPMGGRDPKHPGYESPGPSLPGKLLGNFRMPPPPPPPFQVPTSCLPSVDDDPGGRLNLLSPAGGSGVHSDAVDDDPLKHGTGTRPTYDVPKGTKTFKLFANLIVASKNVAELQNSAPPGPDPACSPNVEDANGSRRRSSQQQQHQQHLTPPDPSTAQRNQGVHRGSRDFPSRPEDSPRSSGGSSVDFGVVQSQQANNLGWNIGDRGPARSVSRLADQRCSDSSAVGSDICEMTATHFSASIGWTPNRICPPPSWLAINMSQEAIASRLTEAGVNGGFFIRTSNSGGVRNPFTLSVYYDNYLYKVRIMDEDSQFHIFKSPAFSGPEHLDMPSFFHLQELVEYYTRNDMRLVRKNNERPPESAPGGPNTSPTASASMTVISTPLVILD